MSWNFTIDDTSPFLSYSPYSDGFGLTHGWQAWYTTSGFNTGPSEIGSGFSYHLTSLSSANVNLQFYGTGVYLYGTTNSSYDITLDNTIHPSVIPSSSDVLYSITNLTEGNHYITLTARPTNTTQMLAFDRAIISSPLDANELPPTAAYYDNSNTTALTYSGVWEVASAPGVPNATVTAPYHTTSVQSASVLLAFSGASAVAVNGLAAVQNSLYSVSVDGTSTTSNGSTFWLVPNTLLFYQGGLDPLKTHTINVTNLGDNATLSVNSITIYQYQQSSGGLTPSAYPVAPPIPTSSSSSHSLPVSIGVIVGPIAGFIVLILIGGFLFWRRRVRKPTDLPGSYKRHDNLSHRHLDNHSPTPVGLASHPAADPSSATIFYSAIQPAPTSPTSRSNTLLEPSISTYEKESGLDPLVMKWTPRGLGTPTRIHSHTSYSQSSGYASSSRSEETSQSSPSRRPPRLPLPPIPPPYVASETSSTYNTISGPPTVISSSGKGSLPTSGRSSQAYPLHSYPPDGGQADVQRILQIIGERMDPHDADPVDDPEAPPPQYRG